MKPQYQTRYELLHESYQKWLTGFTRHAVSWGVCHPNIYYFHNLTPGWVSFNGEKPEIAIVPQSLHRLIYGPDKRTTPPLDDDLIVNLCTSEHLLVHHPMLEGILLSECERLRQRSLANKLISLFRQFGGTELRLKLVWLCWLDLMTGNCLDDWTENLKRKSEKELEEWIINRQNRDSDESWYLRSENAYRAEVPLYASMLTQAMDYDRIVAGSRSHQTGVNGENNSVRLSIQGGHLGHDNNGGIARGATPESSGSYGFVRLEGDLMRTEVAGMSVTAGVYGAAGHSSVDVKDDDGSRAGTVRDDAGSLGGYLNLIHNASGLWADIVALGTRHSMKASTDNNDFRARGWGWLGSLETGLPFSITDNLMLEPQLQYTWQGLSLDDGKDNAGYVKFGHGSAQHVRAGFRLGSHNDMTFGEGTSSRAPLRDSAKHSVSELPVNWWVQPSVIRTFSSRGDMRVGTSTAGSGMTFSPSQNGTSLDLQAGLEARVRENITLGVQAGYAHSVSGSSAEGYNGQATLNVTF